MNDATWGRLCDLQSDVEDRADELNDTLNDIRFRRTKDSCDEERLVVQAMRKAGEVAKTSIKTIGVLDELLGEIRKAKETNSE